MQAEETVRTSSPNPVGPVLPVSPVALDPVMPVGCKSIFSGLKVRR